MSFWCTEILIYTAMNHFSGSECIFLLFYWFYLLAFTTKQLYKQNCLTSISFSPPSYLLNSTKAYPTWTIPAQLDLAKPKLYRKLMKYIHASLYLLLPIYPNTHASLHPSVPRLFTLPSILHLFILSCILSLIALRMQNAQLELLVFKQLWSQFKDTIIFPSFFATWSAQMEFLVFK